MLTRKHLRSSYHFSFDGQLNIYCRGQVFPNFKSQCANLCPILYEDESVMTHICAGKILVQENIAPVDGYKCSSI